MALNYSKWDNIELSDDEDIECHPNVDKKSFIKWNQEAIHQRRAERRNKIKQLKDVIDMNTKVLDKVAFIIEAADKSDTQDFKSTLSQIQSAVLENPSSSRFSESDAPTLDKHLVGLFAHIQSKLLEEKKELNKDTFMVKLREEHEILKAHQKKCQEDLATEEKVENSTLTSDSICKPGFDKTVVNKSAPPPEPKKATKKKPKETKIEILNPKTLEAHPAVKSSSIEESVNMPEESDGEEDIEISDIALKFAKSKSFDESLALISKHPYLISDQYSDEILAHAFEVEMKKNYAFAKNCVHQSLVLQYCNRLGKDGVGLFFARLKSQGFEIFTKDVHDTYNILKERCKVLLEKSANESKEKAIFQLEPSSPDSQLSVYVPTEDEQDRYELFLSLPESLQAAFRIGTIEALNEALKDLDEQEAEQALQTCDQGQFILFEVPGEQTEASLPEEQQAEKV